MSLYMQKSTINKVNRFCLAQSDQHIDVKVRTCASNVDKTCCLKPGHNLRRDFGSRIVNSKLRAGEKFY